MAHLSVHERLLLFYLGGPFLNALDQPILKNQCTYKKTASDQVKTSLIYFNTIQNCPKSKHCTRIDKNCF